MDLVADEDFRGVSSRNKPEGTSVKRTAAAVCLLTLCAGFAIQQGPVWGAGKVPLSPPVGVTAAPGNGSVIVSWDAVTPPAGQSITGYIAKTSHGHQCTTSDALSCTVTGLKNGDTYPIEVRAVAGRKRARIRRRCGSSPVSPQHRRMCPLHLVTNKRA